MGTETQELTGRALDWAVEKAIEGRTEPRHIGPGLFDYCIPGYTTDWGQGGPLIEENLVFFECTDESQPKESRYWHAAINGKAYAIGPTPLIAACRAIVAAKMGDEVDIPEELT